MKCKFTLGLVALVLLIIGGLNWGLVGLFDFDLVSAIFGDMTIVTRIIYVLVALAAIYKMFDCCNKCECGMKKEDAPMTPTQPMN